MKKVLIINGPNLNMLDQRDHKIYGDSSLAQILDGCYELSGEIGIKLDDFQSNSESAIVEKIQEAALLGIDAIIINAAALTHTSVAIRDALEIFRGYKVELHISNIYKREEFRHKSFLSGVCDAVICGFGDLGYKIALWGVKGKA